jgi:hypothetical protein
VLAAAVWDFCGDLVSPRLFWDTAAAIDPRAGVARDRLFSHPLAQPEGLASLWRASGLRDIEDRPLAATDWTGRGRSPVDRAKQIAGHQSTWARTPPPA